MKVLFPFWGQLILVALIASTAKNWEKLPSTTTPVVSSEVATPSPTPTPHSSPSPIATSSPTPTPSPIASPSPSPSPSPITQGEIVPAPLAFAPIPYAPSPTPSPVQPGKGEGYLPNGKCICWRYVENRVPQYPEDYSVQQLEQFAFQQAGFVRLQKPEPGAIVLHQPSSFRSGSASGHIEMVDAVDRDGVPIIATAGDNIPRGQGDAGCPNVAKERVPELRVEQTGVSYWKLR